MKEVNGAAANGRQLHGPVVLVVDDDPAVLNMIALALAEFGFAARLADGGRNAVTLYQQESIDLVLLDVRMPDVDGPHTLKELQKLNPHVRCVFMTGFSSEYSDDELLALGGACVLMKPFHLEELRQAVLTALGVAKRNGRS
jgi:DNA-binding response OmpR family regulator